jgi:hypothetical protein
MNKRWPRGAKRRPTGKKPDLPGTSRAGRARTDDQRISEPEFRLQRSLSEYCCAAGEMRHAGNLLSPPDSGRFVDIFDE